MIQSRLVYSSIAYFDDKHYEVIMRDINLLLGIELGEKKYKGHMITELLDEFSRNKLEETKLFSILDKDLFVKVYGIYPLYLFAKGSRNNNPSLKSSPYVDEIKMNFSEKELDEVIYHLTTYSKYLKRHIYKVVGEMCYGKYCIPADICRKLTSTEEECKDLMEYLYLKQYVILGAVLNKDKCHLRNYLDKYDGKLTHQSELLYK